MYIANLIGLLVGLVLLHLLHQVRMLFCSIFIFA